MRQNPINIAEGELSSASLSFYGLGGRCGHLPS
jgi:hypothetical protein